MRNLTAAEQIVLAVDTAEGMTIHQADAFVRLAADLGGLFVQFGPLLTEEDPESCAALAHQHGMRWIADTALHYGPDRTGQSVLELALLDYPPAFITMHVAAGAQAMKQAVAAAGDAKILGITVPTSLNDVESIGLYGAPVRERVADMALHAARAGLAGVVVGPHEVDSVKGNPRTRHLTVAVTGVRLYDQSRHDHERTGRPGKPIADGADLLMIGRPITDAEHPGRTFHRFVELVSDARSSL